MTDPRWLTVARGYIGQREVPGPQSSPWIRELWYSLKVGAWYWSHYGRDDSRLPWCGALCARSFDEAGYTYPKNYASARAWLDWGLELEQPELGCIAVFARKGGGHVGFVVGRDERGYLLVLGGNQGDAVSIAPFSTDRLLGYRWPVEAFVEMPVDSLPLIASTQPLSHNEA